MSTYAMSSDSREEKIIRYLPLVKYIASRIMVGRSSSVDMDDLINCGVIGLIDAIDKFDPAKGVKFETYASLRIKGSMIDELRKLSWIPRSALSRITKLNEVRSALRDELQREPTDEELSLKLEITVDELRKIENHVNYLSVMSLEEVIFGSDDELMLSSIIEDNKSPRPDSILEDKERYEVLKKSIDMLNEKDRLILTLYYYEKLTLKEIGQILGISESRVSQLHSRMILRLRDNFKKLHY